MQLSGAAPASSSPAVPSGGAAFSAAAFSRMLKRSWLWMVLTFLVTAGVIVAWTFLQKPIYEAGAVVLIDTQRTSTSPIEQIVPLAAQNRTLANEVAILQQSLFLAERVGKRLLENYKPEQLVTDKKMQERMEQSMRANPEMLMERRVGIALLAAQYVSFMPINPQVDMIRITSKHTNRGVAVAIANYYVEEYQKYGQEQTRAGLTNSRQFLQEQVAQRSAQLESVGARIQDFMTREGIVTLDTESQIAVTRVAELDAALDNARVEYQIKQREADSLRAQMGRIQPSLGERLRSNAADEMAALRTRIVSLQAQADVIYARYPNLRGNESQDERLSDLIPQLELARNQLASLSQQMVREAQAGALAGGGSSETGSPISQLSTLMGTFQSAALEMERLRLQERNTQTAIQRNETVLDRLPRQQNVLANLQREQEALNEIYVELTTKLSDAQSAEQSEISYVQPIRTAINPMEPISPDIPTNMILAVVVGLILAFGVAFVRQASDHIIHAAEDISGRGFTLLGAIPDLKALIKKRFNGLDYVEVEGRELSTLVVAAMHPLSSVTETFRHLRTSVQYSLPDGKLQAIMVTSPGPGEGKSTTSMNLAIALANAGKKALYIDADLRLPTGHKIVGINRDRGLAEILFQQGPIDWEQYRHPIRIDWGRFDTALDNFYMLPAGQQVPDPAELLGSQKMHQLLENARAYFDIIILDTSPVLAVTDSVLLSTHCDGIILVASAEQTSWRALQKAREALLTTGRSGAPIIGAVINRLKGKGEVGGYGYSYGYNYKYGDSYGGKSTDYEGFMRLHGQASSGDGASSASKPTLSKP